MGTENSQVPDRSYLTLFGKKIHRAWIILIGCCFLQAGGTGAILLSAGVFYVPICNELGFARSEISLWMTAYFIATIPAMPIAGKILTRFNVTVPMSVSIVVIAAAIAAMSTYTEIWQWIVSGAIVGAFGALVLMMPSAVMIGNWFASKSGLAMGLSACASALAGAFLSPMYHTVIETAGWRNAYLVEALIVVVLCLPWALFVFKLRPEDKGARPYGIDRYVAKRESAKEAGKNVPETREIPYKRALFSVSFAMLFVFGCLSAFIGSGYDGHMPGIAISFGFDPAVGALMLSALQLGSFADKLLMGWLNDAVGVQRTIYIEFLLVILGVAGIMLVRNETLLLVCAFLFGVQDSLISVSVPLLVRQMFGVQNYVQLYAWLRVGVGIFGSFASVVVGLCFDLTGSFIPALGIALGAAIVGAIVVAIAYACRGQLTAPAKG